MTESRTHRIWLALNLCAFAVGSVACGSRPAVQAGPPVAELEARFADADDVAARQGVLEQLEAARSAWPADPDLKTLEVRVRESLGDWSGAMELLLGPSAASPASVIDASLLRRIVIGGEGLARWHTATSGAGDPPSGEPMASLALHLMALGASDPEVGRARALEALTRHPGDPELLTAVAAIDAARAEWGSVLLFADRALAEAQARSAPPPVPARTLMAMALAERTPASASAAFIEARNEDLPQCHRAEARFLVRHGRPAQAALLLAEWLDRYPLDAQSRTLHAEIAALVARMPAAGGSR